MSLVETLKRATADLDALREKLQAHGAAVDAERLLLAEESRQLGAQASLVNSLRIALDQYAKTDQWAAPAPEAAPKKEVDPVADWWATAPRTKAIPVGPTTLSAFLRNHGRTNDPPEAISASLNHLRHRGQVMSLGHGQWVLTGYVGVDMGVDIANALTDQRSGALGE
jgi:hypothetical protein